MSLLDILMAAKHGIGKLPSIIGDPTRTGQYGGAPDYGTYDPTTPGTPPFLPAPAVHTKSNWRDILGDSVAAGIAAGGTPNIAGGGGTDMLRAMSVGQAVGSQRQQHRYDLARQAELDAWNRTKMQQQIEDWKAQAELRRARANDISLPDGDWGSAGAGAIYHRRTGELKKVPVATPPAGQAKPLDMNRVIAEGAQSYPERRVNFDIPAPEGTPNMGPAMSSSVNIPPPANYHVVPGTSGDQQLILQDKGYKPPTPTRTPTTPWAIMMEKDPDAAVAAAKDYVSSQTSRNKRGPVGRSRKTKADQISENTAAADLLGLTGQERKYYIANGRLSTRVDFKSEIDSVFGGSSTSAPTNSSAVDTFKKKYGLR